MTPLAIRSIVVDMRAIDDIDAQLTDRWLTASQVAALLPHVTLRTVQRWAQDGWIPAQRLPGGQYRIRREDVASLLDGDDIAS